LESDSLLLQSDRIKCIEKTTRLIKPKKSQFKNLILRMLEDLEFVSRLVLGKDDMKTTFMILMAKE
jgi:hypothetical protein